MAVVFQTSGQTFKLSFSLTTELLNDNILGVFVVGQSSMRIQSSSPLLLPGDLLFLGKKRETWNKFMCKWVKS